MSSDGVIIDVSNLGKCYEIYAMPRDRLKQLILPSVARLLIRLARFFRLSSSWPVPKYFKEFWALKDISFQVMRGESIGIVGRNGSGKSTLLQLVCSTLSPTSGLVEITGRVAALLELGSGFNPEYTGRENVFLNGQILGLSQGQILARLQMIEDFADIGEFIDRPVKTYSSGMVVRLAFAVAINVEPEILIIDEALAVGDLSFQRKCLAWMEGFVARGGALLFVSHSPEQVRRLCTRAIYLRDGYLVDIGDAKTICDEYERDLHDANSFSEKGDRFAGVLTFSGSAVPSVLGFPECAIHYGNGGARITGAWIEDVLGNQRASFQVGERLVWCYQVVFECAADTPIFGFMVKTKEGVSLFSANSKSLSYPVERVNSGKTLLVKFIVEPNLGAGEYFFNCGVSVESAVGPEFLHRVVDAGMVSIFAKDDSGIGIVHMAAQVQVRKISVALERSGP